MTNHRFEIWQVKVLLDRKIEDVDQGTNKKIITNEPEHIVVYDTLTQNHLDFSSVLGDAQVLEYSMIDDLNGQEDKKLMSLLNKIK